MDVFLNYLMRPMALAEKKANSLSEDDIKKMASFSSGLLKKAFSRLIKVSGAEIHSQYSHLVKSLKLFYQNLLNTPDHLERDLNLQIERHCFVSNHCGNGTLVEDGCSSNDFSSCKFDTNFFSASDRTIYGIVIDYRVCCMLELVSSPDISIEWKVLVLKQLFSNSLEKGYENLADE